MRLLDDLKCDIDGAILDRPAIACAGSLVRSAAAERVRPGVFLGLTSKPLKVQECQRIVYDLVTEVLASKKVSAATFARAETALGRDGIIEAVTCAGFYGMIGLVLNTFEVPPQPGGDVLS